MDLSTDTDGDGNFTNDHDSWFDCHDGDTVNMDLVNDGNAGTAPKARMSTPT